MKILLVTHHWKPYTHHSISSGYQRLAYYLARQCEIELLTWRKSGAPWPDDSHEPFPVRRISTPASDMVLQRRLKLSWQACRIRPSFDLVHALYSANGLFPALSGPTVVTVHVLPEIIPGLWNKFHGLIQRQVFRKASHIIAVSTNLSDILTDRYGSERVSYIPHGVDIHVFRPGVRDVEEKRKNLLNEKFRMITLLVGSHGSDMTMIASLAAKYKDLLFIIVNAARSSWLRGSQHPSFGALPNVRHFNGVSEEEMIDLYECADLFFRPLKFATANNALLEAMAMARPILTSAIPGVRDYLDSSTAFLADGLDDFMSQFHYAVEHPEERRLRGQNARRRAETDFAWETVAQQTVELYRQTLKENA